MSITISLIGSPQQRNILKLTICSTSLFHSLIPTTSTTKFEAVPSVVYTVEAENRREWKTGKGRERASGEEKGEEERKEEGKGEIRVVGLCCVSGYEADKPY